METIFITFCAWSFLVMIFLNYCRKDRISLITNFFVKVLPRIPITGIISTIRKKKEKQF